MRAIFPVVGTSGLSSFVAKTNSGELIVRNNCKILIPLAERKQILDTLHANHVVDKGMTIQKNLFC